MYKDLHINKYLKGSYRSKTLITPDCPVFQHLIASRVYDKFMCDMRIIQDSSEIILTP